MHIKKLKLNRFRSHIDTTFEFARINVIRGRNGAGKSSVQMALELLLTGRCELTDARGSGGQDLISCASRELAIEAWALIDAPGSDFQMVYRRSHAGSMFTVGNVAAGKTAAEWVTRNIAPQGVLSSVLNAHRFLELKPAEQKALLAAALENEPVAVSRDIVAKARSIACFPLTDPEPKVQNVAQLEQVYKYLFDARTQANRELTAIGELKGPERPEDMPALHDVRLKIAGLENQRTALLLERTRLVSQATPAIVRRKAAETQRETFRAMLLSEDELAKARATADAKEKAELLDAELVRLASEINAKHAAHQKLNDAPTECPMCGAKRSKNETAIASDKLQKEITALEKQLEKSRKARTGMGDWSGAARAVHQHEIAVAQVAEADKVLTESAPPPPDTAELDKQIAELTERIARGRSVEEQVVQFEAKQEQFEQLTAKAKSLKERSTVLDELVDYFGPKSPLRAALVGKRLDSFCDRMNAGLARFGFNCEFSLEPYEISVGQHPGVSPLALHQLSESEAYRFGIAFQLALAEATGVDLVVIDRADMLTQDARRQLTEELMSSGLQAFLLATTEDFSVPALPPDVRFFDLVNNGGATTVTAARMYEEPIYVNE